MTEKVEESGGGCSDRPPKLSERTRSAPPFIYINHYTGEGGQWFLKRHGTKYVRFDLAALAPDGDRDD